MLRPAHCSLYLLCSQERKEKNSLFFPFSLQQIPCHFISSVINGESEIGVILVLVWLKTKPQFCSV